MHVCQQIKELEEQFDGLSRRHMELDQLYDDTVQTNRALKNKVSVPLLRRYICAIN